MMNVSSHMHKEQVRLPSHMMDLAADELRSATGQQVDLRPRPARRHPRLSIYPAGRIPDRGAFDYCGFSRRRGPTKPNENGLEGGVKRERMQPCVEDTRYGQLSISRGSAPVKAAPPRD